MGDQPRDSDAARVAALAADLRVVFGRLKRRLREQGSIGDLTWSQVSVLSHLERDGPATVTALAQAESVRPQSMGATIAGLQAAGLVAGAPHPTDGRQTLLSLTPACLALVAAGRAAREDWLVRSIQTHLTPREQHDLARGVELLARLVAP